MGGSRGAFAFPAVLAVFDHLQCPPLRLERGGQDHVERQPQRGLLHLDRSSDLLGPTAGLGGSGNDARLQGLAELARGADDEPEARPHALLAHRGGEPFPGGQPPRVVRRHHGEHVVVAPPEREDVERDPVHRGLGQPSPPEDAGDESRVGDDDELFEGERDAVERAVLVREALPEPVDLRAALGHGGELEDVPEEGERFGARQRGPWLEFVTCFGQRSRLSFFFLERERKRASERRRRCLFFFEKHAPCVFLSPSVSLSIKKTHWAFLFWLFHPLHANSEDAKGGSSVPRGEREREKRRCLRASSERSAAIMACTAAHDQQLKNARTSPPLLKQSPRQVQSATPQREQDRRRRPFGEERLERHCVSVFSFLFLNNSEPRESKEKKWNSLSLSSLFTNTLSLSLSLVPSSDSASRRKSPES